MSSPQCALASELDSYARFHREHRHSPNALYLVYTCRALMPMADATRQDGHLPRPVAFPCLGVGDRFRLICFMLRAAIAFQRVLLIDWQSPMPIEEFFEPSRIDWRLRDDELAALNQHPVQRWAQDLESEPPRTRFLRITGNAQWFAAIRASPAQKPSESSRQSTSQGMVYEPKLSCLWHFIFKPSEWLSRTLAERRTRMFGSASEPYDALHVRMGDAAEGVAFEERSVPRTDRRFSHATALHMIRCVQAQSTLPLFVATDNAALKQAIQRRSLAHLSLASAAVAKSPKSPKSPKSRGAGGRGVEGGHAVRHAGVTAPDLSSLGGNSSAGSGHGSAGSGEAALIFDNVMTQGCSDCMVNPVWHHNFSRASVAEIYIEMGLLAQARCLFHTLSNFAGVAEAWRGERCSVVYLSKPTHLGRCNIALPTDSRQGLRPTQPEALQATCTVTEPRPRLRYELALLICTSSAQRERWRHVVEALGAPRWIRELPRLLVSDWFDGDRTGLVGMRWGNTSARRSLAGALCMAHALVGRLEWLLVLSDDAAVADVHSALNSARALLAYYRPSYYRPWLLTLPRVEEEAVLQPAADETLPGRGCVLHGGTVSGWTRREVGKRTGTTGGPLRSVEAVRAKGTPIRFVEATCDSNECRKLPKPERSALDEAACLGPVAHLDDPRVNMGAAWPQARGSRYGSRAPAMAPAFLLSYGALHVLMGGDPTSAAAGITMVEAPDGSGKLVPKPPIIFPRQPALGVVKHVLKPCLGRLSCPFGAGACANRPAKERSRDTGTCDVRRDQRDDCRSCAGDGMHAQVACCLALAGVYATYTRPHAEG